MVTADCANGRYYLVVYDPEDFVSYFLEAI